MKLRLSILLLAAAALAAAPASGQTIKSLGYNTTNGQIVYSGTNSLTFTNALQFSTNARAATRTNLGGTTVGNAVFTATNAAAAATAIGLGATNNVQFNKTLSQSSVIGGGVDAFLHVVTQGQGEIQIGWGSEDSEYDELALTLEQSDWKFYKPFSVPNATNRAIIRTNLALGATWLTNTNVTNFRTAIGLGATNNVTFSNITASGIITAADVAAIPATNSTLARGIQWFNLGGGVSAIYGSYPGTPQISFAIGTSNALSDVASFRATGMTVASNAVVGGTLAVTGNVTMSGVGNTAPSQTASSGSSLMTRGLSDVRYGEFPSGQTVSVFDDVIYSVGASRGWTLRGTIAMPTNNTEYRLFNAQAGGGNNVGHFYVSIAGFSGAVGFGNITGFMQGNQGDSTALATRTVFNNSVYWVSFTAPTTLTTGDTITGETTGATAKVWYSSVFTNEARNDVWVYDVTGIFTSADTNISRNGTPTGNGIANSVWGASPSTNNTFFIYRTRSTNSNSVTMPAIFNRYGTDLTALFKFEAL